MKTIKYTVLLSVVALMLGVSTAAARATETGPSQTVRAFYKWFVEKNHRAASQLSDVQALFEPALYAALNHADAGIFNANTCPGYIDVSRCPYVTFDPFSYAQTAASSYSVDAERVAGNRTFVSATVRAAGKAKTVSHVTFVLTHSGSHYTISNLLYPQPHYYNFGPIVDLRDFLMLSGAMPLDPQLQRNTTSALGVVRAFYDLYVAANGHIEKHMLTTKALLENSLFGDLSNAYATGGGFSVATCSGCNNTTPFDPFANASPAASSYAIGATRREGADILVPVALRFSGKAPEKVNHITVVVQQHGASFAIGDFRYDTQRYYYAGPIDDFRKFLGKWNC